MLSYDDEGTLRWKSEKMADPWWKKAEGKRIKYLDGVLVAIGDGLMNNESNDLFTVRLNAETGAREMICSYNFDAASQERAYSMQLAVDVIYVHGVAELTGDNKYVTLRYDVFQYEREVALDTSGNPVWASNEIMIKFRKSGLNLEVADDETKQWGTMEELLTPTALSNIQSRLGNAAKDYIIWKAYCWKTSSDTIGTARDGRQVRLLPHYQQYVLRMPAGETLQSITPDLELCFPDIWDIDWNRTAVLHDDANDTFYQLNQSSLHPCDTVPNVFGDYNSDINTEAAWNETSGASYTATVAVIDSGILYTHRDFNSVYSTDSVFSDIVGGGDCTMAGGDGEDIIPPIWDSSDTDDGQGTKITGIIGGHRNNSLGIAGVA